MTDADAINEVAKMGAATTGVKTAVDKGIPFIVVPHGFTTQSLEHLCPPTRVKQSVVFEEVGSFVSYVNRFKTPSTLIFAGISPNSANAPANPYLTAVIDYHGAPSRPPAGENEAVPTAAYSIAGEPAYCSHIARLEFIATPDWIDWLKVDRRTLAQTEFAEWLEEHLHFFNAVPEGALKGADLLELITTLHGKSDVIFNSMIRLNNGSRQLNYSEKNEVGGTAGGKKLTLPEIVSVAVMPFQGGAKPHQLDARLKVRFEGGKPFFRMETIQLEQHVRSAILTAAAAVETETGIKPLIAKA